MKEGGGGFHPEQPSLTPETFHRDIRTVKYFEHSETEAVGGFCGGQPNNMEEEEEEATHHRRC